jgi:hypothetical protein
MNSNYEAENAVKVARLNSALGACQSLGGRWWSYTVSHQTFVLLIGDPSGQNNVVITLAACEHLSGPATWSVQHLRVSFTVVQGGCVFEVRDPTANFLAQARMLAWSKDANLLERLSIT